MWSYNFPGVCLLPSNVTVTTRQLFPSVTRCRVIRVPAVIPYFTDMKAGSVSPTMLNDITFIKNELKPWTKSKKHPSATCLPAAALTSAGTHSSALLNKRTCLHTQYSQCIEPQIFFSSRKLGHAPIIGFLGN